MDVIKRGVSEIIPEAELARKIEKSIHQNTPLNIKLGCDPSRPDLHLGHSVVLRKLRQFQDLGHQAILIVGDFTGMIGDPSGRSKTRPSLSIEETRLNGQSYFAQATKILSASKVKMVYNSEWLAQMNFADVIRLASKYTVARMLERDDFTLRYRAGEPISVHEFLYPLAQAMDSVAINADVELGGTDQKFNLLVGRELQKHYGQRPQIVMTMPLLEGTDGIQKMSKSLGNYIGITEPPAQMFGKIMSISDVLMWRYYELLSSRSVEEIAKMRGDTEQGANPRDSKLELAKELVSRFHGGASAGEDAMRDFLARFQRHEAPKQMPEIELSAKDGFISVAVALKESGLTKSTSEAMRKIRAGAIRIDGERVSEPTASIPAGNAAVLQLGRRSFVRVIVR